ncbi:hypothetical protein ACLX1H_006795 [Fusarium chlamydosporum]
MTDSQPTASLLDQGESIPIAQLNPDASNQENRVVCGTVTITWPFSILTKSVAFLLAERDFRLRRENGQVRVRFHGAAAKAIADASLGAGDEIRVSLKGVQWEKNETQTQVAGSTLAWQLEFTNRLVIGIRRPNTEQETIFNIDVPAAEPETVVDGQAESTEPIDTIPEEPATPGPPSPELTLPTKRTATSTLEPFEYASPAFLKRARVSYGSLFEGGLDMFDDDVGKTTKSKKRSRFSIPGNAWRYTSRSPSPEPDDAPEELDEEEPQANGNSQSNGDAEDTTMDTPSRPAMVDQGSQTADVDFTPMASVQVLAEPRPGFGFQQMTPTPFARTRPFEADSSVMNQSMHFEGDSTTPHGMPSESHQNLLGQQPDHMDTDMAFSFTPQTVLFPQGSGFFPTQDGVPDSPSRTAGTEDYPAALLDTDAVPSNPVDSLMGFAAHGAQSIVAQQNPFATEPALNSTFTTTAPSPHNPWATEALPRSHSANASSDAENPVEILSSSPLREQGSRESSADRPVSPSRDDTEMDVTAEASLEPTLEDTASEAEHYRDGGDEPGDDYDLRKYSRTHDDDDDVDTSEEELDVNNDDPDAQIMNPEEDDVDVDEDVVNQEGYPDQASDEYEEEMDEERFDGDGEEYEGSEDDAEGEYYSDEEDYSDDEENEEEDAQTHPPAAPVTREPVFIDLLSDSEDENETASKPEPVAELEPKQEPEEEAEQDSEASEEHESEPEMETEANSMSAEKKTPAVLPEGRREAEDPKVDEMIERAQPSPTTAEDEESTLPITKEAGHETETKNTTQKETAQIEEASVPASPAKKDSEPDQDEVPAAPTVYGEIKDGDDTLYIEESSKTKQPSVDAPAQNEPGNTDGQPQHEQKAEEKPIAGQAVSDDIEMDTPVLVKGSKELEDAKNVPEEPMKIGSLNETEPTVVEEATEAMDIDAPPEASLQDTTEAKEPEKVEVIENSVTVTEEIRTTVTDAQEEISTKIQVAATQEESLTQLHKTSEINAEETRESPELAPLKSHDTIMQDVSSEEVLRKPATGETGDQDIGELPEKDGKMSPPPTQASQEQTLQEDNINVSVQAHEQHLPTPGETQQVVEVEMSGIVQTATEDNQIDEEDAGPEDQIMAEILQHSPIKQDTRLPVDPATSSPGAPQTQSPAQTEQVVEAHGRSASPSESVPEVAVSKSLRPRRSKQSRASDGNDQADPSMALIGVTPVKRSADNGSKHSSPTAMRPDRASYDSDQEDPSMALIGATPAKDSGSKTRSKTRGKAHRDDPSILLAGGPAQAETKNKRKKKAADDESIASVDNSPPGSQRVLRSRNDHGDPSILLAKGSSPSARQTRSQKTPDPKHETPRRETRSVSRSFQLQEESPDASFASLKSPSIAGSFATVPEDWEEDVKTLKLQLVKSLRTNLPDFLPLKNLRGNINKMTDVLAVVTQTPAHPHRPKNGPRDFMLTLTLTDASTAPTQVRVAHIFRPHLTSLPEVESGDIILLRRVKVVSMKGRDFGVRSEDSSSWAVSKPNDEQVLGQVKGPPVEITPEEIEFAKGLRHWWSLQDESAMNKIETASRKVTEAA